HYVALERSTSKPSSIDIEKFLEEHPDYSSLYKSWQRLDNYMEGKETIDTTPTTTSDETSNEIQTNEDNEDDTDFHTSRKKYKRHVGPHDNGGLQRTISTGTLAPSF
ncbi:unnamed protein product, partial [Adineta steineri]